MKIKYLALKIKFKTILNEKFEPLANNIIKRDKYRYRY